VAAAAKILPLFFPLVSDSFRGVVAAACPERSEGMPLVSDSFRGVVAAFFIGQPQ